MKMDPQNLTLSQLLHGRLFRIPEYQRPYSWQNKQREELFGDLLTLHNKKQDFHFMATVVGVNSGQRALGTDEYQLVDIVDGQQRLTTLILLLRAIALALPIDDPERQKLQSQLVKSDDSTLALLQTNHDYSGFFIDYMRHGKRTTVTDFASAADRNIVEGIASAESFVARWQRETSEPLMTLLSSVKNRLRFIFHALDDERMVYTVFEILNTRGLPVAWLDRCKAVLMGIAFEEAMNPPEMIKELHEIWQRIYKQVGVRQALSSEALRFAATLWSSDSLSKVCSDADALEVFRDAAIGNPNNTVAVSRFIEQVAGAVDELLADTQKSAVTKIAHARLLAVAIELRFSGAEQQRLLQQWEHTSFRIFGLFRRDSRTGVGAYVRLARSIFGSDGNAPAYAECMQAIKALAGSDSQFTAREGAEALRNTDCYDGWEESLRYFLYARERWLDEQSGRPVPSAQWNKIWEASASRTVEHILPQSPDTDSAWAELLRASGVEAERVCHRLGNLVLLPKPLNSQASNSDFSIKRETYRQTGLAITDEIASHATWGLEQIEARETELIEWAAEYWADVE